MKQKQTGFTAIEGLLVTIIILMVGFIGYYVYHSQQSTDKTLNSAADTSQTAATTKKSTNSGSASKQSQTYLTVKEWGVKIPLTSTTNDAYYSIKNGYAYLSLQSLANTDCSADSTTLGVITRFTATDTDPLNGSTYLSENPQAVKVGQYYYFYTHPQAACSDDQTVLDKASAAMTDFKTAVDSIQAE